jgi:hypothetical protein
MRRGNVSMSDSSGVRCLSPFDIVEAIVKRNLPTEWLPLSWKAQRELLGIA